MENTKQAKLATFILPAAVGLIATLIASQVRTPAVEPLPHSTTIYSSGATAYYAQVEPTPTPDPTPDPAGGGVPLKS